MRVLLSIFFLSISVCAAAQTKYVMVREGAPVYEERDSSSQIITTLEYGTAIEDTFDYVAGQYYYKGYDTWFVPVMTDAGKGYVPDAFLLPFPPPKYNVSTIDSYLMQVSEPLVVNHSVKDPRNQIPWRTYSNKTYKNSMFIEGYLTPPGIFFTYIAIPDISIQKAYLLLHYFDIGSYFMYLSSPVSFPDKNLEINKGYDKYRITLSKESGQLKTLNVKAEGCIGGTSLEIKQYGSDVIITQAIQ